MNDADLRRSSPSCTTSRATRAALLGGRRSVDVSDLQTGNADAGQAVFRGARASKCHSPTGDLEGIATRLQGLALLQRMLYPGSGGARAAPPPATVTVTCRQDRSVAGTLAYRDEFTIALTDANGWHRSWPRVR